MSNAKRAADRGKHVALAVMALGMVVLTGTKKAGRSWNQILADRIWGGCDLLLNVSFPGLTAERSQPAGCKDPSYEIYQKYRYMYETYIYLFSGGEAMGNGDAAPGLWTAEAGEAGSDGWNAGSAGAAGSGGWNAGSAEMAGSGGAGTVPGLTLPQAASYELEEVLPMLAKLQDYDYLMKEFYSVHPSTTAPRDMMQAEAFLAADMSLRQDPSVPQILIYHTHSQETYADYGPGNLQATVVEVGNYLAQLLRARGWNVIHDPSTYDIQGGKLDRNQAYTYALEGITEILRQHPTIEVILDIHRDGVGSNVHLMSQVNGKPTANIMFFQGMSRTPEKEIEYLPNPYLQENLAFAFQMQLAAAGSYPDFTRKIYLKGLRYNLHLRPRSSLIEVGAQTNSSQEALNAMEPLSELLDRVLQGK